MRRVFPFLLITPFAIAACNGDSSVSPAVPGAGFTAVAGSVSSQAPTTTPFHLEFDDFNGCTGELAHFVFDGTARLESFADHSVLHVDGTVTTDDGWVGKFNRQLVGQGTELTWRFMDMEVGPTGQRQLFTTNLHGTIVDGEIVWTVRNPSLRCVGKPAAA
jgi:hypothetical protein